MLPMPIAVPLPPFQAGLFIGGYGAAVAGLLAHWVVVASGSAARTMGDQAERWTRDALAPLLDEGWKLIHNARLNDGADIDTLAIGPGGMIVVETKWSGSDWSEPFNQRVIDGAAFSARDNARRVRIFLAPLRSRPEAFASVIALWPSPAFDARDVGTTRVVPGLTLLEWCHSRPAGLLTDDEIDESWTALQAQVALRDDYELNLQGARRRTPGEYLNELYGTLVGAFVGMFAVALAGQLLGFPLGFLAMGLVGLLAWLARGSLRFRAFARGFMLGSTLTTLVFVVAVVGIAAWAAVT
jgi:hypothetical protein